MRIPLLLITALFLTHGAAAADSVPWKEIKGWGVYMDPTMGNGCYAATAYDGGTFLRVGFNFLSPQPTIFVALGNADWKSLEEGKEYPLQIQFDRNPVWDAQATVFRIDDVNYLGTTTEDANFLEEFGRKLSMKATFKGREVAHLRLNGSSTAVKEILACQAAVTGLAGAQKGQQADPKDPFSDAPQSKSASDPFEL